MSVPTPIAFGFWQAWEGDAVTAVHMAFNIKIEAAAYQNIYQTFDIKHIKAYQTISNPEPHVLILV